MVFLNTDASTFDTTHSLYVPTTPKVGGSRIFWKSKRAFDVIVSISLLPLLATIYISLLALNPFFNTGPTIFSQIRMGRKCKAFVAYKFRSMRVSDGCMRGADDPLETNRITKLGGFLRKTRIDELPQILNVLQGRMSLIGPRPDYFNHARVYIRTIPEYRERHELRPGISGMAQVEIGYAEGFEATRAKVLADLDYIKDAGFFLEFQLVLKTISTILCKAGA